MSRYENSPSTVTLVKFLIFGLNFTTFALGVLLLSFSLWVRTDSGLWVYVENLHIERYYWACTFGMISGSLLFMIPLLGCMGALLDSKLFIGIHITLAAVSIICQVVLIILVWRLPGGDRLQSELSYELKYHIDLLESSAKSRNFLDLIQLKLQCCGAYSYNDYKVLNLPVPQSCSNDITNNINYRSCGELLRRFLEIRGGILGGLSLASVLVQLITSGILLAYTRLNLGFKRLIM